ncbi:HYDIN protein, partial [Poecile atricapillus]|nr:HYDIN protein [Poecile atricapillus]
RERKQLAKKLEEEAKALEEEERRKEEERQREEERLKEEEKQKKEKKGVSMGKQPAKPEDKTKVPEKGETKAPEKAETKAPKKGESKTPEKENKAPEKGETEAPEQGETKIPEDPAEMEKNLIQRFEIYESSQQNVVQVFSYWNRVQGTVQLPVIQKGNKSQPSSENKGQKSSKPQEKVEKKPEQKQGDQRSLQSSHLETPSKVAEEAVRDKHVGVPCLDIPVTNPKAMIRWILRKGRLPTAAQMLKYLGLHPKGPRLPPAAVLSIVDYPEERLGSAEHAKAPEEKGSSAEDQPKKSKAASRVKSTKKNQVSTERTESPRDSSTTRSKSALKSASIPTEFLSWEGRWSLSHQDGLWLSDCISYLEHLIAPPSLLSLPRLVFPEWRKTMEEGEIIFKEYVESTKQFHFGPLLCGKSREWYVLPAGL